MKNKIKGETAFFFNSYFFLKKFFFLNMILEKKNS